MNEIPCMEAVVAVLESEGVDTVFGFPGAAILPLYAALQHSGIRHLTVRHEEGGTHMADGWARATGKVGVTIGTSGPAGTNMITGLYTAMADSIPIICITGQAPRGKLHQEAFQAVDIVEIAKPVTKWAVQVKEAGAGGVGVPRGVPDRPLGPARAGADRSAARRAAREVHLGPGAGRAAARRRCRCRTRRRWRRRSACCWRRNGR